MKHINDAIKDSFKQYKAAGARSNKKLIPLHSFVAKRIKNILKEEYEVYSLGIGDSKEKKITGKILDKKVDIAVFKCNKFVGGIGIKFITSNYKQNVNNYIENFMGETFNLRAANFVYSQILIIRNPLPYLEKSKKIKKFENVGYKDIEKYKKIFKISDSQQFVIPNSFFIKMVEINDNSSKELIVRSFNSEKSNDWEKDLISFYKKHSCFEKLFKNFSKLVTQKK